MRIGVFGGTFDPIHLAHLVIAEQCREQAELDRVLFVPAFRPPHKQVLEPAGFAHRVEMLNLSLAGNPAFQVSEIEKDREGLSYTADTLAELQRRHPADELLFILGSDCLPDLPHWHEPARILSLAALVIVARPGWEVWSADRIGQVVGVAPAARIRTLVVNIPTISISSSELRSRISDGRSIRYLVPRAVECYIETHQLYRAPKG